MTKYPTGHSPADEAAAQYIKAVGDMRIRQMDALTKGQFDHWQDLCRAEDAFVRYANQEIYGRKRITED